jgi:hypothetical protein
MLKSLQRDFVIALALLGATVVVLILLLRDLGGGMPAMPVPTGAVDRAEFTPPPIPGDTFFRLESVASPRPPDGTVSPFHTEHFKPPPKPAPKPPPKTRQVQLTYLGFLRAGDGPPAALVDDGTAQRIGRLGSNLVANLFVAGIEPDRLVLTNSEGITNLLEFRQRSTVEVPAQ